MDALMSGSELASNLLVMGGSERLEQRPLLVTHVGCVTMIA
jgi:hypothetical protein